MDVEIVIASEDLLRTYPEVYHYTDRNGFEGMATTDTLWATHHRDLNDAIEIQHMRAPLGFAT